MVVTSVFISYAHEDQQTAQRLRTDLEGVRLTVWYDEEDLAPGNANWQEAVRRGIFEKTDAMVLVASPHAATSRYVIHEMDLARTAYADGRVFPFWVRGAQFAQCVPMPWGSSEYIDARAQHYAEGLNKLLVALGVLAPGRPIDEQSGTIMVLRGERRRELLEIKGAFRDRLKEIFSDSGATTIQKAGAVFSAWTHYEQERSGIDQRWGKILAEDGAPSVGAQFDEFLTKLEALLKNKEQALVWKIRDIYRLIEPYLHRLSELDKWWGSGPEDKEPPPGTVDADSR